MAAIQEGSRKLAYQSYKRRKPLATHHINLGPEKGLWGILITPTGSYPLSPSAGLTGPAPSNHPTQPRPLFRLISSASTCI